MCEFFFITVNHAKSVPKKMVHETHFISAQKWSTSYDFCSHCCSRALLLHCLRSDLFYPFKSLTMLNTSLLVFSLFFVFFLFHFALQFLCASKQIDDRIKMKKTSASLATDKNNARIIFFIMIYTANDDKT